MCCSPSLQFFLSQQYTRSISHYSILPPPSLHSKLLCERSSIMAAAAAAATQEPSSKEIHHDLPDQLLPDASKKDVADDDIATAPRDVEILAETTTVGDSDTKSRGLNDDDQRKDDEGAAEEGGPLREESSHLSDLKDAERKALLDLRSKLEDAILSNKLFVFKEEEEKKTHPDGSQKTAMEENDHAEKENSTVDGEAQAGEEKKPDQESGSESVVEIKGEDDKPEKMNFSEEIKEAADKQKEAAAATVTVTATTEAEGGIGVVEEIDKDIKLWGVHLLPSKGDEGTDAVLLKFLRAREFRSQEAFEMLRNSLKWRKDNNIDNILEEEFPPELSAVAFMQGVDKSGHPVCYNIFETFLQDEIQSKICGTEETRQRFFRWRFQMMERGIQKLDFASGPNCMLQVNDMRNSPGPTKKDLRLAMKQAVALLQDNYPEFVSRYIFINMPFWSYAYYAVVSPFFTQRTKSKCDFARPAKVTETLLKYISAQQIPVAYGGFHRENDPDFSIEDGVTEVFIKSGAADSIEILAPEVGTTLTWEITALGWEVQYKEEFVPTEQGSYTMIVQKGRKVGWQEGPLRNSFKNKEPGKLVLTIDNTAAYKKKRVLYRYKSSSPSSPSSPT